MTEKQVFRHIKSYEIKKFNIKIVLRQQDWKKLKVMLEFIEKTKCFLILNLTLKKKLQPLLKLYLLEFN